MIGIPLQVRRKNGGSYVFFNGDQNMSTNSDDDFVESVKKKHPVGSE